jgi:hypothetical protein
MSSSRSPNRCLLAVLLALLLALPATAALAQTKSFVYDQVDSDIDMRADGALDVVETMTLAYSGGQFSFVSRSIALDRLDDIRDIRLSEGQRDYVAAQAGKQPGSFVTERASDKLKITWYHDPASDTTGTFTLRYRVLGAVRVGSEADQVWWVAIFPERSVPIQRSRVALHLPAGAQLREQDVTLPSASGRISLDGNIIRVTRDEPLPPGESLDVRVDFAPNLVSAAPPAWQSAPVSPLAASGVLSLFSWSRGYLVVLLVVAAAAYAVIRGAIIRARRRLTSSQSSSRKPGRSSDGARWPGGSIPNRRSKKSGRRSRKSGRSSGSTASSWSSSDSSSSSWSSSDSSSSSWSGSDSGGSWSSDGGSGGGGGDAG